MFVDLFPLPNHTHGMVTAFTSLPEDFIIENASPCSQVATLSAAESVTSLVPGRRQSPKGDAPTDSLPLWGSVAAQGSPGDENRKGK